MSVLWMLIISAVAIFNLSLISVLCWMKSKNSPANFWMACFLFSPAIAIVNNVTIFQHQGIFLLHHFSVLINLSWGAYLIEFVQSLHKPIATKTRFRIQLYVPSFLYIPYIIYSVFHPELVSESFELAKTGQMTIPGAFYNVLISAYSLFATLFLLRKEYQYKPVKKDVSRRYIKEMLWLMLTLLTVAFIPFILQLNINYIFLYMPVFGQVYFLYIFFRFNTHNKLMQQLVDASGCSEKYATLSLNDDKSEEIKKYFLDYIETHKTYLIPDYTMSDMAKDLKILPNQLSMVINSKLNSSYPDYVNALRVKKALELLKSSKSNNLTIEAIAYESGFNNRTTFYKVFKKTTGKKPSEFLNPELSNS